MAATEAHALSDRSVEELLLGPGTFLIEGPDGEAFYDASERGHLGDARTLLGIFLIAGGLGIVAVGGLLARGRARRALIWWSVARAGLVTAVAVVVLGIVSLVAFDSLFTLFHQVFFPGGNWSFDPGTQRLVQLYPFSFWQIAAGALGVLVFLLGTATWLLARSAARRAAPDPTLDVAEG